MSKWLCRGQEALKDGIRRYRHSCRADGLGNVRARTSAFRDALNQLTCDIEDGPIPAASVDVTTAFGYRAIRDALRPAESLIFLDAFDWYVRIRYEDQQIGEDVYLVTFLRVARQHPDQR